VACDDSCVAVSCTCGAFLCSKLIFTGGSAFKPHRKMLAMFMDDNNGGGGNNEDDGGGGGGFGGGDDESSEYIRRSTHAVIFVEGLSLLSSGA